MEIYTSYMANWRHFANCIPVSIMAFTPKYFDGVTIPTLAPSQKLLTDYKNKKITFSEYSNLYYAYLERYGSQNVMRDICEISKGKDIVLLCTCKNLLKCHRLVLADFIEKNSNVKVRELPNSNTGIYKV